MDARLAGWRESVLRRLLFVLLLLSLSSILFFSGRLLEAGTGYAVYGLLSAAALVWLNLHRTLPYWFRAYGFLTSSFIGMIVMLVAGFDGAGPAAHAIAVVLLSRLLLSFRAAVVWTVLAAGAFVVTGVLYDQGLLTAVPIATFQHGELSAWMERIVSFAVMLGLMLAAAHFLLQRLEGELERSLALVSDLQRESAERSRTSIALEETRDRLEHAQKMEVVGLLAGGLAHDMNNALTVIIGEAGFLRMTTPEASESATQIHQAADHASQLTRQLLGLGRRDAAQPRPVDMAEVLGSCARAIRRILPASIQIELDTPDEPATVVADPQQIQQILFNLALNARDAMPRGGTLVLAVARDDADGESRVRIAVGDTGVGIPGEELGHVFEPFFTTKAAGVGTGLGLSSVAEIVRSLGGTIALDSAPGQGTRLDILLPRSDQAPEDSGMLPRGALGPAGDEKILVVEDDIRVRAVICATLGGAGYNILEARDGEEAIEMLDRRDAEVSLVWTDVVMPRAGAAPLIDWLESHRPRVAILVCSGYTPDENVRRGIATGRYPFLAKPFSSEQALAAVRKALARPARNAAS